MRRMAFKVRMSRYLNEQGIEAAEVKTEYGNDEDEAGIPAPYETVPEETTTITATDL